MLAPLQLKRVELGCRFCPGAETNLTQKLVTLILAAEFASKMQY
jgi:hypothetical protein